jgi:hypothetical protein
MPATVYGASTFGLTLQELRTHANALHRGGWSAAEIMQVLAIEPVRSA